MPRGFSSLRERQHEHIKDSVKAKTATYEQLYSEARRRNLKGRSSMNKAQLARALGR